ncbi:MAG: LysM peptidoglycan-binding domain-containing protein [Planctomycetes bacterium]|nr:LysM peptidoglycan-binding domain-containing protein [Planctomycetota bacterium]
MGSGAKVVLVALLIIMVVVVAKVVQKGSESNSKGTPAAADPRKAATTAGTVRSNVPPAGAATPGTSKITNRPVTGTLQPRLADPRPASSPDAKPSAAPAAGTPAPGPAGTDKLPLPSPLAPPFRGGTEGVNNGPEGTVRSPLVPPEGTVAGTSKTGAVKTNAGANLVKVEGTAAKNPPSGSAGDFKPVLPGESPEKKSAPAAPAQPLAGGGSSPDEPITVAKGPEPRVDARSPGKENDPFVPLGEVAQKNGSGTLVTRELPKDLSSFPREYVVQSGEGYWRIAETVYGPGKGAYCKFIQEANKNAKLVPGKKITVPAPPAVTGNSASSGSSVKPEPPKPEPVTSDDKFIYYTVQKGDTWTRIAERFYKDPNAFPQIQAANRKISYETLRAGQKILIPKRP